MAKAKFTKDEISEVLRAFTQSAFKANKENYAFAAGYLSEQLASVMVDLPRAKQAEILYTMNSYMVKQFPGAV